MDHRHKAPNENIFNERSFNMLDSVPNDTELVTAPADENLENLSFDHPPTLAEGLDYPSSVCP